MNYTPLPDDIGLNIQNEFREAPTVVSTSSGSNNVIKYILIIIALSILIAGIFYFLFIKQKKPEVINVPLNEFQNEIITPTEKTQKPDFYTMPITEKKINTTPTETQSIVNEGLPNNESNYPELPEAGMPAPLLVAVFLGVFIIIVGFAF